MRGRHSTTDPAFDQDDDRLRRDRPERIVASLRGEQALGILDASGDAVLVIASDGAVAYANAMAAEVFAAPTTLLAGQPADLLVPQLATVVSALTDRRAGGDLTAGPAGEGTDLAALRLDGT